MLGSGQPEMSTIIMRRMRPSLRAPGQRGPTIQAVRSERPTPAFWSLLGLPGLEYLVRITSLSLLRAIWMVIVPDQPLAFHRGVPRLTMVQPIVPLVCSKRV